MEASPAWGELEDFFENGSIPMHWVGADGTILRANRAELELLGYERGEYVGRPIADFHVDAAAIADILLRLGRNEIIRDYEARLRCRDGSVKHVLIDSSVLWQNGRFVHTRCFTRDITRRRVGEQALSAAIQRLEALYHLADRVGRAKDLASVCEAAVTSIMAVGATRASVLLFDATGVMRFQAWRNLSDGYRAAVDGHSPWSPDTTAPAAIMVDDVAADTTLGPLRDVVLGEGIRALAFVPLVSHGQLLGKFMVYYDAPHVWSAEEMRLAAGIAQHVAFGVARVRSDAAIEDLLVREQAARREADAARVESEDRRVIAEELARLARALNETLDVTAVAERIAAGDHAGAAEQFVDTVALGPGSWAQTPPEIQAQLIENAPTFLDESTDPDALVLDVGFLREFDKPILLTHGDQSPPPFAPVVTKLAQAGRRVEVRTLRGAGHVPHLTDPDAYVATVLEFASRQERFR
jgi:PAS domain S-box-containing protein